MCALVTGVQTCALPIYASLDSSADLTVYGDDVEGVTAFHPDGDPEVAISDRLANDPRRENRLRTTLAHEFRHVHFHRHLWAGKFQHGRLFDRRSPDNKAVGQRERERVGAGKCGSVRVELGGGRIIKKKKANIIAVLVCSIQYVYH